MIAIVERGAAIAPRHTPFPAIVGSLALSSAVDGAVAQSGDPIGLSIALSARADCVHPDRQTAAEAALWLHGLGCNVLPQPPGQKGGGLWQFMQHGRLRAEDLPAVFAGRCNVAVMPGRTSGGLFVLDCESAARFEAMCSAVRSRGLPLWAYTTGRGGHVWLRCADSDVKSIASGRLPEVEVRGQGRYVLAPPSIHPTGAVYQWIACEGDAPPVVSAAAVDFLHDADGQPVRLEAQRGASWGPRFNRATRDYLERGASLPEGERHNRFLYACRNYRDCGLTAADMERELAPLALASGLPPGEVASIMVWAEAHTTPKTSARRAALPDPDALEWTGRTARTDCAVFVALVNRARLGSHAQGVFRASWRELLALAGIADKHALRRALARLQDRQLVERLKRGDHESGASLWRFGPAALAAGKCGQSTPLYFAPCERSSGVDYAFFAPAEWRILAAVATAAAPLRTRQDIARAARLAPGVVQNALRTEGPLRLTRAIVKEGGEWRAGEVDALEVQKRTDQRAAKRYRIARRSAEERAKNAAIRLIAGRRRGGW